MTFTKERIIEELKASTQNASGMFEISDDTICALMTLLTSQPAPVTVPDERAAFEAFVEGRFKDSIDRKRVKNGDQGYFSWDMIVAWIVWQGRAAMQGKAEPVSQRDELPGWVACSERMPDPKSDRRVCVYTPSEHEDMRYRFVPASLFKAVCTEATHWHYMEPPAAPQQEAKP